MTDLNRDPKTLKDARLLIEQLRGVIQRRPDFVLVDEVHGRHVDLRSEPPVRLKKQRFKVVVVFDAVAWEFNSMEFGSDFVIISDLSNYKWSYNEN